MQAPKRDFFGIHLNIVAGLGITGSNIFLVLWVSLIKVMSDRHTCLPIYGIDSYICCFEILSFCF